jgi:hypothetical protein
VGKAALDWIMATGVRLPGPGLRKRDWKRIMGGYVSYSSEFKFTVGADVDRRVVSISISFPLLFCLSFYFTVMFTSIVTVLIVFVNQWGLIPRMGKTHR